MGRGRGVLWVAMGLLVGCVGAVDSAELDVDEVEARVETLRAASGPIEVPGERIRSRGAFSCDFEIDLTLLNEPIGAIIERDRILFQRFALEETGPDHPGMIQKYIPILPTGPTTAFGGGRYLFQGRAQAAQYERFVTERVVYPGDTQFLDRPEFSNPDCRDYTTLLAWRFGVGPEQTTAFRTERFETGRATLWQELTLAAALLQEAPRLLEIAHARGFAELHILHNLADHVVQLVYSASATPPPPGAPDEAAFGRLVSQPPLADELDLDLTVVHDQTSFVLNTWLPYHPGDTGDAARWPNSPPFPEPACGDGVCVPSRGEVEGCPADCAPGCGNGLCDPGESVVECPTDCPIPLAY